MQILERLYGRISFYLQNRNEQERKKDFSIQFFVLCVAAIQAISLALSLLHTFSLSHCLSLIWLLCSSPNWHFRIRSHRRFGRLACSNMRWAYKCHIQSTLFDGLCRINLIRLIRLTNENEIHHLLFCSQYNSLYHFLMITSDGRCWNFFDQIWNAIRTVFGHFLYFFPTTTSC